MMPDDIDGTIVQKPGGQTTLEVSLAEGADPTLPRPLAHSGNWVDL